MFFLIILVEFETNLELKEICSDVVKNCKGVPLAIKVLGNLMAEQHSIDEWRSLQQPIPSSMSAQHPLQLSYSRLPGHLKKCLHYLAVFPKDTDIEAEKLYNLWIADEEMITSERDGGNSTTLSTAKIYLKRLATLGLVQVEEEETPTSTPTKIKSCRLPHFVRDFCSRRGNEESLFATVDLRPTRNQETRTPSSSRALAFYFDKRVGEYDFPLNPKTYGEVRSILFLNTRQKDQQLLSPKSLVLKNCKLLRVLDFNWLDFHAMKFPEHIQKLAHLRYLSFRDCRLKELPPSVGKLLNLETLDLRVNPTDEMSISNVLYKLTGLGSLYFPYKFHAIGKLKLDGLSKLENLKNFVSKHCQADDLSKLNKLKYLAATIEGDEVEHDLEKTIKCIINNGSRLESSSVDLKNFDCCYSQRRRSALRDLLGCGFLNVLRVRGQIHKLPCPISDKLTEIFLNASELTEDPMPVLENLPNLQKLGMCNGAFLGDQMVCRAKGFPQLRYLELSELFKLKKWTLGEGAMLNLSTLTIERCNILETLPDGLGNLQQLSIVKMPKAFTDRYETEGQDFSKIQHVLSIKIS